MPRRLALFALTLSALVGAARAADRPPASLTFADLAGWRADDHAAALAAYRRTCTARSRLCAAAARAAGEGSDAPRAFFEAWFRPVEVAAAGFLTGYFEPEVPGSGEPTAAHPTPLRERPPGLVMKPEATPEGWPAGVVAARRTGRGYEPLPDRGAIQAGALGASSGLGIYVDPVDAFMIQVQGSGRVRFGDGRVVRVGYDGRNGYPYTAIGKVLAAQEGIPPAELTADRLWAWLKANPDRAPAVMRANRSYVFFRRIDADATSGPIGAAGIPLEAGRSLAVDHRLWRYGVPIWLEGELPTPGGGSAPLRRLVVAQDTGTAIVGPARGDLYVGSGAVAGAEAALVRHAVRWVALRPKRQRPGRPSP